MWYIFDCVGKYFAPLGENTLTYKTKKCAIEELTCLYLDRRKRPVVKKQREGLYLYIPHPCDGGTDSEITLLHESKIDEYGYRELIDDLTKEFNEEQQGSRS